MRVDQVEYCLLLAPNAVAEQHCPALGRPLAEFFELVEPVLFFVLAALPELLVQDREQEGYRCAVAAHLLVNRQCRMSLERPDDFG